jgi:hypothetical protein
MSSTNRGHEREKTDYYVTPPDCIKQFLSEWFTDLQNEDSDIPDRPDKILWFDPCAGGDEKHGMSYADTLKELFGVEAVTLDIRDDSRAKIKADYLTYTGEQTADVIISNPPFMHAEQFIRKALRDVNGNGYVVMLLRLNFLGSKARRQFFNEHMPERIYVHHRRMSFTDDGKTDSIEYAHFVWKRGTQLSETKLKII